MFFGRSFFCSVFYMLIPRFYITLVFLSVVNKRGQDKTNVFPSSIPLSSIFSFYDACQMNGNTGWLFLSFYFHLINFRPLAYQYCFVSLTVAPMSSHPLSYIIFLNSSLAQRCPESGEGADTKSRLDVEASSAADCLDSLITV